VKHRTQLGILCTVCIQSLAWSQSLFISAGESITVNPGSSIYIGSDVTNNGSIDLKASAGSYAQLKLTGTYSGTGTFSQQQHLANGWHLLASSVSNGYNATSNGSTSALYAFNTETPDTLPGLHPTTSPTEGTTPKWALPATSLARLAY
jgi:hypothetical protein